MDELYFVIEYKELIEATEEEKSNIDETIKHLLKNGHVKQLLFNKSINDYQPTPLTDFINLEKYAYLASKQGMLAHHNMHVND